MRSHLAACLAWCATVLALAAGTAWADGVIRDGLGAISSGRGGTNIAHADNGQILFDNPAAMVNISGHRLFEVGFDVLMTDLHYADGDPNDTDNEHKAIPLGQLAYICRSCDENWAFGIGAFAPAGFSAEYDLNGPFPIGGVERYKSFGAMAKIIPGIAHRLTDRVSVGATLGVAVSHAELEGPFFLQSGGPIPTVLDLQATGATITWSLGMQYELGQQTTLGLSYQSETRFNLDGNARADVFGLGQSTFDADVHLVWPQSLGLGVKHDLCEHRSLSLDVIWYSWSNAFDTIDLQLSGGTNPMVPPAVFDHFPLDWDDSVSLRVGYEHLLSCCRTLRFGYAFHPNQIPLSTLTPYIQAILEHAFSIGYGTYWGDWNVDVAYQFSFGPARTVGNSAFLGGDFDNARHEAHAHWGFLSFKREF